MEELTCRDCGRKLPAQARGCPTCAWNVEAERKVERIVWPLLLIAVLIVLALIYSRFV